jgi:hypothetical protein
VSDLKTDVHEDDNGVRFNCINWDISVFKDNGELDGLGFTIKGKSDKHTVNLVLWRDDVNPELCAVRHILAVSYLTGIDSGFLFGSNEEIRRLAAEVAHAPSQVTHCGESVRHGSFLQEIQTICNKLIPREGPFGTHSMRKTAYLLAFWGKADETAVIESARHKSLQVALR